MTTIIQVFRTIIAGSRSLSPSVDDVERALLVMGVSPSVVLSGMAHGADRAGERWAAQRGVLVERYPPDWHRLGKRAGFVHNEEMARNAGALLAFWDGDSRGTRHMVECARRLALRVAVMRFLGGRWVLEAERTEM